MTCTVSGPILGTNKTSQRSVQILIQESVFDAARNACARLDKHEKHVSPDPSAEVQFPPLLPERTFSASSQSEPIAHVEDHRLRNAVLES